MHLHKSVAVSEMSGRPKWSSSSADDLDAVLNAARKALSRADGWTIEQSLYGRLRADLEAIDHTCNDYSVTVALRTAFSEITRLRRRVDASYSGLEDGQTLYDCRWKSGYFKRTMYLKFAINSEFVELFRLHEHRESGGHEVH